MDQHPHPPVSSSQRPRRIKPLPRALSPGRAHPHDEDLPGAVISSRDLQGLELARSPSELVGLGQHEPQYHVQQHEQKRRRSASLEIFRAESDDGMHAAQGREDYVDASLPLPSPEARSLGPPTPATPLVGTTPSSPAPSGARRSSRILHAPPNTSGGQSAKVQTQSSLNPSQALNETAGSDGTPYAHKNMESMRQHEVERATKMREDVKAWTDLRHKRVRVHLNKDRKKAFAAMSKVERAQLLRQHGTAQQLTHPAYLKIIDFAKYYYIPKAEAEAAPPDAELPSAVSDAGRGVHESRSQQDEDETDCASSHGSTDSDMSVEAKAVEGNIRRESPIQKTGRDTTSSPNRDLDEARRWNLEDCPDDCERHPTLLEETLEWLECASNYSIMGDLPLHGCFFLMLGVAHLGPQPDNAKRALKVLAKAMILKGGKLKRTTGADHSASVIRAQQQQQGTGSAASRVPPQDSAPSGQPDASQTQESGSPFDGQPDASQTQESGSPFDVNVPYCSDLEIWRGLMCEDDDLDLFDQGMYTGETVLHFAIAMDDKEMVEFLLHNGAKVDAKASGVFFLPRSKRKAQKLVEDKKAAEIKKRKLEEEARLGVYVKRFGSRPSVTKEFFKWFHHGSSVQRTSHDAGVQSEKSEEGVLDDKDMEQKANIFVHSVRSFVDYLWGQDDGDLESIVFDENEWSAFPYHKDQYLGQTPLSLAVALGFTKICQKIKNKQISRSTGHNKDSGMSDFEKQMWRNKELNELINWRLLVNAKDDLGNTALHLAVLHGQKKTFDWLMNNGAERGLKVWGPDKEKSKVDDKNTEGIVEGKVPGSFNELNNQGLTPLTYAVWLGDLEMYAHIVRKYVNRQVWKYGSSELRRLDLMQLDTFRIRNCRLHDNDAWRSVFEIIVLKENAAFAQEPVFKALVRDKWNRYAWRMYVVFIVFPYIVVFGLFGWATELRMREVSNQEEFQCDWGGQSAPFQLLSSVLGVFVMIRIAYVRIRVKWRDLDSDGNLDVSREEIKMFIFKNLSSLFCLLLVPLFICIPIARGLCATQVELNIIAAVYVIGFSNFLNLITPFKFFSVLILTIFRMLIADVLRFLVVYCIVLLAFSGAVHVLAKNGTSLPDDPLRDVNPLDDTLWKASLQLLYVSLGEVNVGNVVQYSGSKDLMQGVMLVWIIITNVLLLNLLISMMAETFQRDQQDHQKDPSVFPVAQYVLECEKTLSEQRKCQYRSGTREGFKPDPQWDQEYRLVQLSQGQKNWAATADVVVETVTESKEHIAMSEHRYLRLDILEGFHDERVFPPINKKKTTSVLPTCQVGAAVTPGQTGFWPKIRSLLRGQ